MPPPTNTTEVTTKEHNTTQQELREIQQLWKELGISSSSPQLQRDMAVYNNHNSLTTPTTATSVWQPILCIGFGTAILFNIGILCSLPPVLRGRGAPFLPTYEKNMIRMFQQLRNEPQFMNMHHRVMTKSNLNNAHDSAKINFVDLGSGDGRIVFHAAYREQLFTNCIGYEINPFLHCYAILKQQYLRMTFRRQNHDAANTTTIPPIQTEFHLRDLWKVNLQDVNVVAVYGLGPIMKELGTKLQNELPHGSYVLSNVFTFPGWIPLPNINKSTEQTYIYRIPDCYNTTNNTKENAEAA